MRKLKYLVLYVAVPLACPVSGTTTFPDCANGPEELTSNLVCDTSASPPDRAAAIVDAMNLTEKLDNLVNTALGAERLGLAPYQWWSEALHGVGESPGVSFADSGEYSFATSFANPITISAAFDDDLVEQVATVVSTEARAFSNVGRAGLDFWTPNINPYKDPRWGRGMETPGEDPFRIKRYTERLLRGLEAKTDDGQRKVIATCKHFAAYDLERWYDASRHSFDAQVSVQELVEYYLPPFQQCARDSVVGSIMCSYNSVNGAPACANEYLLQTVLRDHWMWTGDNQYIVSDCDAIEDIWNPDTGHGYVPTAAEGAGVALTTGTDNICEAAALADPEGAYNGNFVSEDAIDKALKRQYEGLVRVGYFDPEDDNPYRSLSWADVNAAESQALARNSAADSLVLLKNDGFLPMPKTGTLAMIGMWANASTQMLGNYAGIPPYTHSPLTAAEQLGFETNYASGPIAEDPTTDNWTGPALDAVEQSDVVIYFGGIDLTIEKEEQDRVSISWPDSQRQLIEAICSKGKPCIVVQLGNQLDDTPLLDDPNVSGILWTGYPGQDGGAAVFDVLTGAKAPAGRLPVTQYPVDYVYEVPMTDMSLRPSDANPGRTYQFYNDAVLPFGYGLHYTEFEASFDGANGTAYSANDFTSSCTEPHLDLCPGPSVSVSVTNNGEKTSDFIALAFLSGSYGPEPYPLRRLAAYNRFRDIEAGETRQIDLQMTLGNLARVDENGNTVLYPGDYSVLLDSPAQATLTFTIAGDETVLDEWPQPPPSWR